MKNSGILLHISSLPSPYGIGTLGAAARSWIDWMQAAGETFWQVLPVGQTSYGDSPYQSPSAYAGNPYFVDFDILIENGLLTKEDCAGYFGTDPAYVDYGAQWKYREPVLRHAYERFAARGADADYEAFCEREKYWLDDYARFSVLKTHFDGCAWQEWDDWARCRRGAEWAAFCADPAAEYMCGYHKFVQYEFYRQWADMRAYARERGVYLIGDMPIYVAADSADVWAHPEYFRLDADNRPVFVAGVPPDYFSETGQLWGNPLYDWEYHAAHGYDWWIARVRHNLALFDYVRIDHFRGFAGYYAIPYGDPDARGGHWEEGPGMALFHAIEDALGELPILAEDLGAIDDAVRALRDGCGFPGMKILQFAFDGNPQNEFLPAQHIEDCVVYTGTHDNATLREWIDGLDAGAEATVRRMLGLSKRASIANAMFAALYDSVAETSIAPMQDVLGLGAEARMNLPNSLGGNNWEWRMRAIPSRARAATVRKRLEAAGRCPSAK